MKKRESFLAFPFSRYATYLPSTKMFNTCEKCGLENVSVINSRKKESYIHRRRKCLDCGFTFSTREIRLTDYLNFTKTEVRLPDNLEHSHKDFVTYVKEYLAKLSAKEQVAFLDKIVD
jgi:hypothetical protein